VTLDYTSLLFPAPQISVHYILSAPQGHWRLADNGVYEIRLTERAVADTHGNAMRGTVLGSFEVRIAYTGQIAVTTFDDAADAALGDGDSDDGTGRGTLRSAIQEANLAPGENTLVLEPGVYRLSVAGSDEDEAASGDLDVADTLTIVGNGATIDAAGLDRVFDVLPGATLTLRDVMITGGRSDEDGAGLRVAGATLSIRNSTLYGNLAEGDGGAIAISGNGMVALLNVTVSTNTAANSGGIDLASGSLDLTHVTITENGVTGSGGGLRSAGGATLVNTIAAGNTLPPTLCTDVPTAFPPRSTCRI
jgi:hypothetical protein